MNIVIRKESSTAIYEQIVTQIKEHISKGLLREGDALPSIRLLAKDLKVSVITTKRAYEELEREGFIVSVAGKGSYVSGINTNAIRDLYREDILDHLTKVKKLANDGAISDEELIAMVKEVIK